MNGSKPKMQVVFGESIPCADLDIRLAKIYSLAILRYNQSKSNNHETANDVTAANSPAVLTPNADASGAEADC